jgi:hypothetical protein
MNDLNIRSLEMEFTQTTGKTSTGNELAFFQFVQAMAIQKLCHEIAELKKAIEELPKNFAKYRPVQ